MSVSKLSQKSYKRASEMAQWVRVLVTKPDDLSSILGIQVMKRDNQFLQIVLYMSTIVCLPQ